MGTIVLAVVILAASAAIARELRMSRDDTVTAQLLSLFSRGATAARDDPRQVLIWQPLARTARTLYPASFRRLDSAAGGAFPFGKADLEAAHARWTSDWLAWERAHDDEYKLRAAAAEEEITRRGETGTAMARARLGAIEREQLARYQQRYEEYVKVAKALSELIQ